MTKRDSDLKTQELTWMARLIVASTTQDDKLKEEIFEEIRHDVFVRIYKDIANLGLLWGDNKQANQDMVDNAQAFAIKLLERLEHGYGYTYDKDVLSHAATVLKSVSMTYQRSFPRRILSTS